MSISPEVSLDDYLGLCRKYESWRQVEDLLDGKLDPATQDLLLDLYQAIQEVGLTLGIEPSGGIRIIKEGH